MDDLISRQAAIDAADAVWSVTGDKNVAKVWDQIRNLPSAQLELANNSPKGGKENGEWIPCSERLPRQGQEVICQCRANMIKVLKLDACGDWYQDAEHGYMSGFVIAWMPLPEPYQEGES